MFPGHLHTLRIRFQTSGVNNRGNGIAQQFVKAVQALLAGQIGQITVLHIADQLDSMGIKVLKISHQLESRTVHAVDIDFDILIVCPAIQYFQGKLIYDLLQVDKAFAVHFRFLLFYL